MTQTDSQAIYEQYQVIPRQKMQNPVVDRAGDKRWYNDRGEFHRVDGPAVEHANGSKWWYINGRLHREDGHSYEGADGSKMWIVDNKYHREDGPAVEHAGGYKEWYINDIPYHTIPEWAAALFKYKGWTREALKNKNLDYNTLLNALIKMMKSKYGK